MCCSHFAQTTTCSHRCMFLLLFLYVYILVLGSCKVSPSPFLTLVVSATIRRLYDIANILISLQLIQKLSGVELKSRKALFVYIGPQSEHMTGTC